MSASASSQFNKGNYYFGGVRYDTEKAERYFREALVPLYGSEDLRDSVFYQEFLKRYGADAELYTSRVGKNIVALAALDPRFKDLLLSLGWEKSILE